MVITLTIVIIDTGLNIKHEYFMEYRDRFVDNYVYSKQEVYKIDSLDDLYDTCGHGTAVNALLCKYSIHTDIVNIIVKDYEEFCSDDLQTILKYINKNIKCNLIQLSCGICECYDINALYLCCKDLFNRGVYIISALDNTGCISYPAAFDIVLGIDFDNIYSRIEEYDYYENSEVNIRGGYTKYHLPSYKDNTYEYCDGTSFLSVYFTALIAEEFLRYDKFSFMQICNFLKVKSRNIYRDKKVKNENELFSIKRAIVFPFNKEVHSLLRYKCMLDFEIVKVLDSKYSGNVNRSIGEILNIDTENMLIESVENLDWNYNFDTVILGHLEKIEQITKKNYYERIIKKCSAYKKQIYIMDDISKKERQLLFQLMPKMQIYNYCINKAHIKKYNKDKLFRFGRPVLAILGTSRRQGKFTLQLELRKRFIESGYQVGQLGTEPTSKLFHFDKMAPIGYNASVHLDADDLVYYLNSSVHEIEMKEPDIIIVGNQSQTLNSFWGNQKMYPYEQFLFLLATNPDAYILCVNVDDPVDYVSRTINYIESITCAKNVGLVIFPVCKKGNDIVVYNENKIEDIELLKYQKNFEKCLEKNAYILGNDQSIDELYEHCIEVFSEDPNN